MMKKIIGTWILIFASMLINSGLCAQGLIWQAERGTQKILLLGSIHICDQHCYPLATPVRKALKEVQAVAVEIDATQANVGAQLAKRGFYPAEANLRQVFTEEQLQQLEKILKERYGKPLAPMLQMRPWLFQTAIALYAAEAAGLNPLLGIDVAVLKESTKLKRKIIELETLEEQLRALETMTALDSARGMTEFLDWVEDGKLEIMMSNLVVAWKRGNAKRMQDLLDEQMSQHEQTRKLMQSSLTQRNQRMVKRLLVHNKKYSNMLVVVGAMHFLGDGNMLQLLAQQGYKIQPVAAK